MISRQSTVLIIASPFLPPKLQMQLFGPLRTGLPVLNLDTHGLPLRTAAFRGSAGSGGGCTTSAAGANPGTSPPALPPLGWRSSAGCGLARSPWPPARTAPRLARLPLQSAVVRAHPQPLARRWLLAACTTQIPLAASSRRQGPDGPSSCAIFPRDRHCGCSRICIRRLPRRGCRREVEGLVGLALVVSAGLVT